MDERLIAADPREVMRRMAEAYLAAPAITAEQGEIQLAPHQVEAASRLLRLLGECGGAVLADATGLGKTFVAIAVARLFSPVLIVAPAALRSMWRESLRRTGVDAEVDSYEAFSRAKDTRDLRPTLLIFDEAHHARNPRAKRYAALADLAWGAKVLLLTATPIHNRSVDLRALIALFMGSRAHTASVDEIRRVIVRRTSGSWDGTTALPTIAKPTWLAVPGDPETFRAIKALPPAAPAAGGAPAHALLLLGLIRAWSSSEAALRATLRRRLRRAALIAACLEHGRIPDRRELDSWPIVDDAIQLGLPGLFTGNHSTVDLGRIRSVLDRHVDGVRSILDRLNGVPDDARMALIASIREQHAPTPIVAFTQFADTATAAFRSRINHGGVALVTGQGARVASGRVTVDEIVRGFDHEDGVVANAMPLELLMATDVLSEGLSLRRAGVIVHLDLPWTMARLEQRVGRLRRLGSRHRSISVYAIGPPIEARELVSVVRALQRKARLTSSIAGPEELLACMPLLGDRLTRATSMIVRQGEHNVVEQLRSSLAAWTNVDLPGATVGASQTHVSLGLVGGAVGHRLVAVLGETATVRTADVLTAVRFLSRPCARADAAPEASSRAVKAISRWLETERGRDMVQPALDAPSAAHVAALRALERTLPLATRTERAPLARRVARCRQLVLAARGIGAEIALARLLDSTASLDLAALEQLLDSRAGQQEGEKPSAHLQALLYVHNGTLTAWVRDS